MITPFAAPGARRGALRILSAAALVAMVVPLEEMPVQAQPSLIEFDAPGASTEFTPDEAAACTFAFLGPGVIGCGTTALANNDSGQVVGTYTENTDSGPVQHGFLRGPNGDYTNVDAPGAGTGPGQGTVAFSINKKGVIAGAFQDAKNVYHGFLQQPNGSFEQLDYPGAGTGAYQGTLAFSVNQPGTRAAGTYIDANGVNHGFVQTPSGSFERIDPPGSVYTYPCEETCVTPGGDVVGYFVTVDVIDSTSTAHGFVRSPSGAITPIDPPNSSFTIAASINTNGLIAGYFVGQDNVIHGFVRSKNSSFVTFDNPAASTNPGFGTVAYSINSAGATTGEYLDANAVGHGYERDADGHFTPSIDAPDAGTGSGQGTRPSTNNSSGEVTGWYINSDNNGNNVYHGFVWQPSVATQ
jgi:hypothetical protein